MSHYRRDYTPGATYFFTVVTYRRRAFLCDDDVRAALRDAIQLTRVHYPFVIEAWVLLPDHLHCIWKLPTDDADHSTRWQLIKHRVTDTCPRLHKPEWMTASKIKHRESTVWQRRHIEHRIRDDRDFANHCDYIHYNPVKHGLTNRPCDWPYSSFHRFVKRGIYPQHWALANPDTLNSADLEME
ncbi:MAG: REP-associated tyrosine transposase [Candidatus Methylumidiphilus sp.]